ncbi:hypothetical protein CYJ76_01550 [Kytococcus schroeteri]|uniref:Glycosyltransferase subfamily 4-like N-terminal domain-containing protein n=1 Tax=Kytococcus schroeteri TaxID=138300 RepID=A0A2I1PD66_9MICO|nr:glycosyltransferase [Kytococcus schroeteri]PKZ42582.1 hypothetical protein CYJ76_01550 [Kytococcus schroeteri]
MRVLILLKTNEGGMWILPQVRALRARGEEVVVCIPEGDGKLRRALDGESIEVLPSPFDFEFGPRFSTLRGLLALRSLVRQVCPDVVLYHLYASALAGRLSTIGLPLRRVHMVAGPLYLDSPIIARLEGFLRALDDTLISGSEYTFRRYEQLAGPRPGNHTVVPYGVDAEAFVPATPEERRRARRRLGILEDEFVAIIVAYVYAPKTLAGYTTGVKGHDTLIEAWDEFAAGQEGVRLLIVGGGFDDEGEVYRQELMARYPGRGLLWTGKVTDVASYYAAADVSVSPSLSENHGAACEAGALGLPSIVSDAGGLPETVDTASGWVFPRGDVPALADRLRAAHQAFVEGRLRAMGVAARDRMVRLFHSPSAAESVADAVQGVVGSGDPVVTAFTEAHFHRGLAGVTAPDGANGDSQWGRYAALGGTLRVAGRTSAPEEITGGEVVSTSALVPLPEYHGAGELVRASLPLILAVDRAVAQSDLVICRVPGPIGTLAALSARCRGVPYVTEMVGDPLDVLSSGAAGEVARRAAKGAAKVTRWVVSHAAAARFVTRSNLQAVYPAALGRPVFGIPNVRIPRAKLRSEPRAMTGERVRLLAVGSQETNYKGHDIAIRALGHLREDGVRAHLVLVGGGRLHEDLKELAGELGLTDSVEFTGAVSRSEVRLAMEAADILVHPSRTEGLPRVVVEAMATGLPVVATPVGGVPELVPSDRLVGVDDHRGLARAVASLLDPVVYEESSRLSLETAEGYVQERVDEAFAEWVATLRSLAQEHRARNGGA